MDLLAFSITNQCQHYYTLENPLSLGNLGWNALSHPWTYHMRYMFPPTALVSLVLSTVLVKHVTVHFRPLILVVPSWIKASWPATVLNMLEDRLHKCHHKINLVREVSVGWVLKDLPSLPLTLCLLRHVTQTRLLFISLSGSGRCHARIYKKSL